MPRILSALLVTFFLTNSALARQDEPEGDIDAAVGDKWALVVGISKFKNPSINLKYAAKDATDFADYLVREAGFAADHVKVLTDEQATQKHIMSELGSKWLPRVAAPSDLVVIFISSHGSPSEMDLQGVNYIVAHDSDPDDLYTTAIEMQDLVGAITKRVHAKRIVVLLDSCHSGGAATEGAKGLKRSSNFDLTKVPLGKGQFVISSSQQDQVSWELKSQPNGAFTYCLLETLRRNKDATISEIFRGLKDRVQQAVLRERGAVQTPVARNNWIGNSVSLHVPVSNPHGGLDSTQVIASLPGTPPTTPITTPPVVPTRPPTITTAPTVPLKIQPTAGAQTQIATQPTAELPSMNNIAILPCRPTTNVQIRQLPPGYKVLWGLVRNASETAGIPNKVDERIFRDLRSRFGQLVLGPHATREALQENALASDGTLTPSSPEQWRKIGDALHARFLVASSIDEVGWDTSVMSNKYNLVISSKLISAETGTVISELNSVRVKKAPFHGDVSGGRKYFENEVSPEAADQVAKAFSKQLEKLAGEKSSKD